MPTAKVQYVAKEEDPRDYRVSFAKLEKTLNFKTRHTVKDGITEIVRLLKEGLIPDFQSPSWRN